VGPRRRFRRAPDPSSRALFSNNPIGSPNQNRSGALIAVIGLVDNDEPVAESEEFAIKSSCAQLRERQILRRQDSREFRGNDTERHSHSVCATAPTTADSQEVCADLSGCGWSQSLGLDNSEPRLPHIQRLLSHRDLLLVTLGFRLVKLALKFGDRFSQLTGEAV